MNCANNVDALTGLVSDTVVPLLRDHPVVHTKVVFEEGWSFIRGRKQCKPKHVSSGIVVLNERWSLIRVVSQEGDYCNQIICCLNCPRAQASRVM